MGTVSQFHNRQRPVAHKIESEEEAIAIARRLATAFAQQASERDINRILPYAELDQLSQSGLTAVTIPPEHEGLDVSNALLGEIVAIIAEGDSSVAECLELHFRVLEQVRILADDELRSSLFARALTGERFAGAYFAEPDAVASTGSGYRLAGRSTPAPGLLFADWFAITGKNEIQNLVLYLPREAEGLRIIDDWDGLGQRTNGGATIIADGTLVTADATSAIATPSPSIVDAITALLHAGTSLGIARAVLANLAASPRLAEIGKLVVTIEAAAALVESAGRKLDVAQVSSSQKLIESAFYAASAAQITASSAALETANALFALSGNHAAGIGRNLDRHWRNARIHGLAQPANEFYSSIAGHYFSEIRNSSTDR